MNGVGIVGLGVMGAAVGRRLSCVVAGPVTGVETRGAARRAWETMSGRRAVGSVADAGPHDTWLVVVRTAAQVDEAVSSVEALGRPAEVYVLTTIGSADAEALGGRHGVARAWPVAVTGGEPAALRGQLVAAVPDSLPEAGCAFLSSTVAGRLVRVGGFAQVASAKALVNAMIAYQFAALRRIVDVGEALGVAPRPLVELIQHGSAGSAAFASVFEYDAALAAVVDELVGSLGPVLPCGVPEALASVRNRTRVA